MSITCSPDIAAVLREHNKLVRKVRYTEAKALLWTALMNCYKQSPISADVAVLLDDLAIDCKDLEQFEEAALYHAQSLAIKKLLFGPLHKETIDAEVRLATWRKDVNVGESAEGLENETVRCLVLAKDPPRSYFPDCGKGYAVRCQDGRIAYMYPEIDLEIGQEVEAVPVRLYFGKLIVRLQNSVVSDGDAHLLTT
jgi:hypothetical protein